MPRNRIIAVTGLKREAAILMGPGVDPLAGGGDSAKLERKLVEASGSASGIISIGLAGALSPDLKPGDWVIGQTVVTDEGDFETDARWTQRVLQSLSGARAGVIAGGDSMIVTTAAKHALGARTGAVAVDMESHIAARVAKTHGLPFAVARVISDGADHALPVAAQRGMRPDGGMDVLAVLASLLGDPRQLPALIRTALAAETAFRALLRGRQLLGPALGGPDLG